MRTATSPTIDEIFPHHLRVCDQVRAAKRIGFKIIEKRVIEPCTRCGGDGIWKGIPRGTCYGCGGDGKSTKATIYRRLQGTDEQFAQAKQLNTELRAREEAEAEKCRAEYEAKEEQRLKEIAEREAANKAKYAPLADVIEGLRSHGQYFQNSLADSLENGEGVYGRGIYLAAEYAAKGILGKKRRSKAVDALIEEIITRIKEVQA